MAGDVSFKSLVFLKTVPRQLFFVAVVEAASLGSAHSVGNGRLKAVEAEYNASQQAAAKAAQEAQELQRQQKIQAEAIAAQEDLERQQKIQAEAQAAQQELGTTVARAAASEQDRAEALKKVEELASQVAEAQKVREEAIARANASEQDRAAALELLKQLEDKLKKAKEELSCTLSREKECLAAVADLQQRLEEGEQELSTLQRKQCDPNFFLERLNQLESNPDLEACLRELDQGLQSRMLHILILFKGPEISAILAAAGVYVHDPLLDADDDQEQPTKEDAMQAIAAEDGLLADWTTVEEEHQTNGLSLPQRKRSSFGFMGWGRR
jgi:hypothetical protein